MVETFVVFQSGNSEAPAFPDIASLPLVETFQPGNPEAKGCVSFPRVVETFQPGNPEADGRAAFPRVVATIPVLQPGHPQPGGIHGAPQQRLWLQRGAALRPAGALVSTFFY